MARMVSPEAFAVIVGKRAPEKGGREVTADWIRRLCRRGLIEGAEKESEGRQEWRIPANAPMPGERLEFRGYSGEDGYTPAEFAVIVGVSKQLVHHWIQTGKLPRAEKTREGWKIPKRTRDPRKTKLGAPKPAGRPRKSTQAAKIMML